MKKVAILILASTLIVLTIYSCTKTVTVTKTDTVTVTDTVTKTIIDSNINLKSGLLAYYPFNGNANDTSGNNMNGALHGGVSYSNDVNGKANSAVTFDGSTGYIMVPDSAGKFQTNSVSVSFWANITNISARAAFVSSLNFTDGSGYVYGAGILANTEVFQFGVETNTLGCALPPFDINSIVSGANIIVPNKWYHIVGIFSDSLQQLYVNGVLNTAVTRTFRTLNQCSNNKVLMIGGWWSGDLVSVSGSMDEVRVYNRALNQNEITKLAIPGN